VNLGRYKQVSKQGRLHHINDGAKHHGKSKGGRFLQPLFRNLGGREDKFIAAVMSSAN